MHARIPNGILSQIAGSVTRLAQERWVTLLKGLSAQRLFKIRDPMPSHRLASEDRRPTAATNGCRDKGIVEIGATRRQGVQVRRLDLLVTSDADAILRLIIGEEKEDVRSALLRMKPGDRPENQCNDRQS